MILADENIHSFITKTLRESGIEVVSVGEDAQGIKDQQVIAWAQEKNYTILTEDKDFGEWVFAHHIKDISVLFLRYSFQDFQLIAFSVRDFLLNTPLRHPVYVTLTTKKIRIRQL